jgi:SAM-dependent methyltransferase
MAAANRYVTSWERFWSTLSGTAGEIFCDAAPAHAAQQDLGLFQGYADPQLPLLDLGCGNGTPTRFLAEHFAEVIGTEIAPTAVEIVQAKNRALTPRTVFLMSFALGMPKLSTRKLGMRISTTCGRWCTNFRPWITRRHYRV